MLDCLGSSYCIDCPGMSCSPFADRSNYCSSSWSQAACCPSHEVCLRRPEVGDLH